MLSSSPSSVARLSTSFSSVAALTNRTRTVSHSRCEISSSESFIEGKKKLFRTDVISDTFAQQREYKNKTYGWNAFCRSMISNLFEVNRVYNSVAFFFTPKSPRWLLKLEKEILVHFFKGALYIYCIYSICNTVYFYPVVVFL